MSSSSSAAPSVDFIALQQQLLEERKKVEKELGLDDPGKHEISESLRRQINSANNSKRSRGAAAAASAAGEVDPSLLRRSSRVAGLPSVDYKEKTTVWEDEEPWRPNAGKRRKTGDGEGEDGEQGEGAGVGSKRAPQANFSIPGAPAPGALKSCTADPSRMNASYLGQFVPFAIAGPGYQAKRAVIIAANATAGVTPKLSAMGGIKEWANSIFLFVNIGSGDDDDEDGGGDGADGGNEIMDGGRLITWYAQNKQTEASAQIHRLINHKTGCWYPPKDEGAGDDGDHSGQVFLPPCSVCLICRLSPEDPYVWCGELEYESHVKGSHPIKFTFRLKQRDQLMTGTSSSSGSISGAGAGGSGGGAGGGGSALFRKILAIAGTDKKPAAPAPASAGSSSGERDGGKGKESEQQEKAKKR